MATQHEALRLMLDAINAMREFGYTQENVQELVTHAWEHLEGSAHQPYAFGHCTNCNRLIIGWSVYQWTVLVHDPAPGAESPGKSRFAVEHIWASISRCSEVPHLRPSSSPREPHVVVRRQNIDALSISNHAITTPRPDPVQLSNGHFCPHPIP